MKKRIARIALALILVLFVFAAVFSAISKKSHAAEFVTNECPDGFKIIVRAFSLETMPEMMKKEAERLIRLAASRDTRNATNIEAYKAPETVARRLGRRLRMEINPALVTAEIGVRFVDTNHQSRNVGVLKMANGVGVFRFSEDPRDKIVDTIWPSNFISPEISGGEARWRMVPAEWGTNCTMNQPGLVP